MADLTQTAPTPTETRSCEAAADRMLATLRTMNPGATVTGSGTTTVNNQRIVGCNARAEVAHQGATTRYDVRVNARDGNAVLGVTNYEGQGQQRRVTSSFSGEVPVVAGPNDTAALGTNLTNTMVRPHSNQPSALAPLSPEQLTQMGTLHDVANSFARDAGLGSRAPAPAAAPLVIGRQPAARP